MVGKPLPESHANRWLPALLAEKKQLHQDVTTGRDLLTSIYVAPVPSEGYANIYGRDITDLHQAHERLVCAQRAANAGCGGWDLATESIELSPEMSSCSGSIPDGHCVIRGVGVRSASGRIVRSQRARDPTGAGRTCGLNSRSIGSCARRTCPLDQSVGWRVYMPNGAGPYGRWSSVTTSRAIAGGGSTPKNPARN